MWMIWTNKLLPKALKSCPKSNKSPNLVTLSACLGGNYFQIKVTRFQYFVRLDDTYMKEN